MEKIKGLAAEDVWDYENGFLWYSDLARLNKLLAQYELYKHVLDLPGDVVELGTFKGASAIKFATFRQLLETDYSRKIVCFDAFGPFPDREISMQSDIDFLKKFEEAAGTGLSKKQLDWLLREKKIDNFELVGGNIFDTLPDYLVVNPQLKISLLHLDMDVMEPTAFALEHLYERVVKGGMIVVDDYPSVGGTVKAVDIFLEKHELTISKLPYYSVPSFIIKK